jgi:hypothetical protein
VYEKKMETTAGRLNRMPQQKTQAEGNPQCKDLSKIIEPNTSAERPMLWEAQYSRRPNRRPQHGTSADDIYMIPQQKIITGDLSRETSSGVFRRRPVASKSMKV